MKKVILSPCSAALFVTENNERKQIVNPKNYPYWTQVVQMLRAQNIQVIQVGVDGEPSFEANYFHKNLSLQNLKRLLDECDTWVSVDNFFAHFATYYKKAGVVVFGISDPLLFGYESNLNLLKDRKYLRANQFDIWQNAKYDADSFVEPEIVVGAICKMLSANKG